MASTLHRITTRLCRRTEIHPAFRLIGCRSFFSDSYGQSSKVQELMSVPADQPELALQCLHIDRCQERNLPITSLMLDRVFRSVKNDQHADSMRYYLHRYRHSANGYYLHTWIQFAFTNNCLKHNPNTLFEVLKSKSQYGVFPHYILCNLILDKMLKQNNLKDALKVVDEIFLLEHLDHKTTQTLVLKAIAMHWDQNMVESSSLPSFEDIKAKRNIAGSIYCIGKYISNPTLEILGSAILGSIEKEHGINTVFQDPWGPMLWTEGYLERSCNKLSEVNESISQQCVSIRKYPQDSVNCIKSMSINGVLVARIDVLLECVREDESLSNQVLETVEKHKEKKLVSDTGLSLTDISDKLMGELESFEEIDKANLDTEVSGWLEERDAMYEVEKELIQEKKDHRESLQKMEEIEKEAHDQAVAKLGYWFYSRKPDEELFLEEKEKHIHLQKDYVDGCMTDLELLEAFRKKQNIHKDPIILMQ